MLSSHRSAPRDLLKTLVIASLAAAAFCGAGAEEEPFDNASAARPNVVSGNAAATDPLGNPAPLQPRHPARCTLPRLSRQSALPLPALPSKSTLPATIVTQPGFAFFVFSVHSTFGIAPVKLVFQPLLCHKRSDSATFYYYLFSC